MPQHEPNPNRDGYTNVGKRVDSPTSSLSEERKTVDRSIELCLHGTGFLYETTKHIVLSDTLSLLKKNNYHTSALWCFHDPFPYETLKRFSFEMISTQETNKYAVSAESLQIFNKPKMRVTF